MNGINVSGIIGKSIIFHRELDSTNDFAMQSIANSAPTEGTVIMAENQTVGRGQQGSKWDSAPGQNLLTSTILKPVWLEIPRQFYLNMSMSLAVRNTVANLLPGREVLVKWPNDILVDRQKIAGILIENLLSSSRMEWSVVGIGLNVNQQIFPDGLINATSLNLISGRRFDVKHVASELFNAMDDLYAQLKLGKSSVIRARYLQHLYRYQEMGWYLIQGEKVQGQILGIEETGRLMMEVNGQLRAFNLKEVGYLSNQRY